MYGPLPAALGSWANGHDGLASADPVRAGGELPWFLANGGYSPITVRGRDDQLVRKFAPRGSMISFTSAFEADGRTWLLTPELSVVPADRVRVYRPTSFHGVERPATGNTAAIGGSRSGEAEWRRGGAHVPDLRGVGAECRRRLTGKR
jgi:hypothetical protein